MTDSCPGTECVDDSRDGVPWIDPIAGGIGTLWREMDAPMSPVARLLSLPARSPEPLATLAVPGLGRDTDPPVVGIGSDGFVLPAEFV